MTTVHSCCSTPIRNTPIAEPLPSLRYRTLEKVCRIAIGFFAAATFPTLFFPTLAVGATANLLHHAWHAWNAKPEERTERNKPLCTQGYMELLSDRRYPEKVNLTITALFIAAHTHCMPQFYVPLCGVTLGIWAIDQIVGASNRFPFDPDEFRTSWQHDHIV